MTRRNEDEVQPTIAGYCAVVEEFLRVLTLVQGPLKRPSEPRDFDDREVLNGLLPLAALGILCGKKPLNN